MTPISTKWNKPFLVHLSQRLKCTIVITRRPSVRPSLTFHIYDFSSETTEENSMKLDRKQELDILYQVCVFQVDRPPWPLIGWHFWLLLWNRRTEFNQTWQEARTRHPLPSLCISGRSEKQDGRPGLWLPETFSTSPLKPLSEIQRKLTGKKISMPSTKSVFFGQIGKTRWPPWPLIGWDIFDFSSETTQRNSTKLDRKKDLNVLYQVCVFRTDRKNKMAALAPDWLRHFRLLLWNRWMGFNETWQEAISQRPLPRLGRSEKQDGRLGLWLAETFSTSPLKPLNGTQRNLTGSKISTSSTKFVFFGPIGKTRWPPWHLIGWDIFDFSKTAERNSTKLVRKKDLNVLYQVCVFRLIEKTRWPPWPLIGWDIFYFSSETAERNSTKLDRKQDLTVLYQVCVFWADQLTKMSALADSSKRWLIVLRCTICGPLGLLFSIRVISRSQGQRASLVGYACQIWSLCYGLKVMTEVKADNRQIEYKQ